MLTLHNKSTGHVAKVSLFGATVVHYGVDASEEGNVLFVSKEAVWDGSKPIRGGIPVVFPIFGAGDGTVKLPAHGFARTSTWTVEEHDADGARVRLALDETGLTPALAAAWPFKFKLQYDVSLGTSPGGEASLTTELRITNTGSEPFDFQSLLHTYFAVPHVSKLALTGLAARSYVDQLDKSGAVHVTAATEPSFVVDREVDWIFTQPDMSKGIFVAYSHDSDEDKRPKAVKGMHTVATFAPDVTAAATNPDVVVWNPWIEKSKRMADFGDDEYLRMVCVEPGNVRGKTTLAPGRTAALKQVLTPRM